MLHAVIVESQRRWHCRAATGLLSYEQMILPEDIGEACLLPFRMSKSACPTGKKAFFLGSMYSCLTL